MGDDKGATEGTIYRHERGRYRELIVWQKALDLADAIYDASDPWPEGEHRRLGDQIRRAAISVPSNIAEGQGRDTPGEIDYVLATDIDEE